MNGPEHYTEAERLLEVSLGRSEGEIPLAMADAAAAQVHATLALVAAIANTAHIEEMQLPLVPQPKRYERGENGVFDYQFPWREALR